MTSGKKKSLLLSNNFFAQVSVNDWLKTTSPLYHNNAVVWEQYHHCSLRFKLHKLPFTQQPRYFLRNFLWDEWTGQNRLLPNAIVDKPWCTYLPRNLDRKNLFISSWLFDVVVHYGILNTHSQFQSLRSRLSHNFLLLWWKFGSMGFVGDEGWGRKSVNC